jgi:hypothetical protein
MLVVLRFTKCQSLVERVNDTPRCACRQTRKTPRLGPKCFEREVFFAGLDFRGRSGELLVLIRMAVAPIPVFGLLLLVRLRVFVGFSVVFRQELPPGAIFLVIPVVIILVILIVNAFVFIVLLRRAGG